MDVFQHPGSVMGQAESEKCRSEFGAKLHNQFTAWPEQISVWALVSTGECFKQDWAQSTALDIYR